MMKKILICLATLIYQFAAAQKVNQCGIIIPPKSTLSNFQSVYEAVNILIQCLTASIGKKILPSRSKME